MSDLERQIKELAAKAEAWDDLVRVLRRGGEAALAFNADVIVRRADRIDARAAAPAPAAPIHTTECTLSREGECISYHCPECGLPASSQGHRTPEHCQVAKLNHKLTTTYAQGGPWCQRPDRP